MPNATPNRQGRPRKKEPMEHLGVMVTPNHKLQIKRMQNATSLSEGHIVRKALDEFFNGRDEYGYKTRGGNKR